MGENKILSEIPNQAMIIRTAWVYHTVGSNFVNTMLRLMSQRKELNVVNDQRGSPTFARSLAQLIWDLIQSLSNLPCDNNNSKVFSSKLKCIPDNELLKSGI